MKLGEEVGLAAFVIVSSLNKLCISITWYCVNLWLFLATLVAIWIPAFSTVNCLYVVFWFGLNYKRQLEFCSRPYILCIFYYSFRALLWFSHQVVSDSLWLHGLQHARLLCPPLSLRVCSNSCPLCQWCYVIILSSAITFSFCLQSFPASGSFPVSRLLASGGQSIRSLASVMNIQGWFPLGLISVISLLSKEL